MAINMLSEFVTVFMKQVAEAAAKSPVAADMSKIDQVIDDILNPKSSAPPAPSIGLSLSMDNDTDKIQEQIMRPSNLTQKLVSGAAVTVEDFLPPSAKQFGLSQIKPVQFFATKES